MKVTNSADKNCRLQNMLGLCFSTWEVLKLREFYSVELLLFMILIFSVITARDIIVFVINFYINSIKFFTVETCLFINIPI